jgi:hypothetical protein
VKARVKLACDSKPASSAISTIGCSVSTSRRQISVSWRFHVYVAGVSPVMATNTR